jgi:outer membrane protein TolC
MSRQPSTEAGKEEGSVVNLAREQEIRRRAYEIYLERGQERGRDLEDWLQAERELASHEITSPGE